MTVPPALVLIPVPLSIIEVFTIRIVALPPDVAIPLVPLLAITVNAELISADVDVEAASRPLFVLLLATLLDNVTLALSCTRSP